MTTSLPPCADSAEQIARDVAAVQRISAVPALLQIVCDATGMGFAAVARVTDRTWTACAVRDTIGFGLGPGGQLELATTLCMESRQARQPILIDHASQDPTYCAHHTPRIYNIESYVSVPIVHSDGTYFGNLCAIDPEPHAVSDPATVAMFKAYAELIARQLDVEAQHQATEVALHRAERIAEIREQLVAILGHDLRNPLAAIAAHAQVLIRRGVEADPRERGARIKASADRMSLLISDILDFTRSRLGADMGVSKDEGVALGPALQAVVAEIREAHPERGIVETVEIDGPVFVDQARIEQLVSNLLGNAIRHGDAGTPVDIKAWAADGSLCIEVSNQGNPIPPDEQAKIFQPYWRSAASDAGGGLGLGLHICTQIVAAHRGTLTVTSTPESGTTFAARLPCASPGGTDGS